MFLDFLNFPNLRIWRLQICEMFGQVRIMGPFLELPATSKRKNGYGQAQKMKQTLFDFWKSNGCKQKSEESEGEKHRGH